MPFEFLLSENLNHPNILLVVYLRSSIDWNLLIPTPLTVISSTWIQLKDILPYSSTSFCVYQFTCSYRASYIGRTTRRLSIRAKEHHPAWLYSNYQTVNTNCSALTEHLVSTGHVVICEDVFKPIYSVTSYQPQRVKQQLLAVAKSVAIRLYNPDLCVQKPLKHTLSLCWPVSSRTHTDDTLING